uniref:Primary cilia formation n=1 Tax=Amazona collaria TaxID=241587 RepID=A0A8B9FKA4_9PSIT
MLPLHDAPDRLGIQLKSIRGQPSLGPGCYLSQEVSSVFLLGAFPSWKGYVIGARTAQRFQVQPQVRKARGEVAERHAGNFWYCNHHIPAPETGYFVPVFFRPGTYKADKQLHKRITWPMKFGSPDWSLVPMPPRRMLKMEITIDKEFRRHRNRVAYLSLYFS